ncbi:ran-binding protein 3 isoform X2 [Strongylocentrotus purpuratus]|uniref:RanBD1 domain-containing protein n=1 Tax=Strongylocentrotus purpuratus TaxID=7668 RepID=A0A7M7T3Y6_STRPU|nr:ran-binding protein 3 isoform X2 [Strongylocentrotus purpuratus]
MAESQPVATALAGDSCNPELSNGEEASVAMDQDKQGIKRPAEQQIGPDDINKEFKPEEPGEFPKADDDVIAQRAVFAPSAFPTMGEEDDNAIDEDGFSKPTFRLNPPTLIHGQAKSAPTSNSDGEEKANENKPLLRPSALNNHGKDEGGEEKPVNPMQPDGAHSVPFAMAENNSSETDNEANKRTKLFLPFTTRDTSERDLGFGVFGKFRDSAYRIGFTEQDCHGNASNSADKEPDPVSHEGATQENYFKQFASKHDTRDLNSSGDSPSSLSSSSGSSFLFGQNMNERVTSPNRQEGELQSAGELVFGNNLASRIKSDGFNETSPEKTKEQQTLAENASALEEARERMRRKFEDVESVTGEEDEENVVQSHGKLFVFDNVKRNWLERGRGQIRLNDSRQSAPDSAFQSRLVMRTQGSLRLILNTKIWSGMTIEKATNKNLRISAMDAESDTIKVFLITGTPKDIEQLFCAIEYRVQALKHVEESERSDVEEGQTGAQDTKDGDYDEEDEDEEDAEDDDEDDDEDSEVAKICSRDRSKPTSPKSTEGNSASASPSLHPEES